MVIKPSMPYNACSNSALVLTPKLNVRHTHRSGHPHILSASGRRFCARKIRSGQAQNAADLQRDYFPEASKRTMRRNLTEEGLPGRRMRKKFFLKPIHRKKRKAPTKIGPRKTGMRSSTRTSPNSIFAAPMGFSGAVGVLEKSWMSGM